MCGSGTIVIEAARRACGRAPGGERSFAFVDWPGHDGAGALARARDELSRETAPHIRPVIVGSDRDAGAIEAARANATRGGVATAIDLAVRPLSACEPPPGPGLVLCNPPYGVRVGKRGPLRDLYAQLGNVLRARWPGSRVALLCGDELWRHCDLPLKVTRNLRNGGLPVQLVQGAIPR
jgi:putative N6-adenine-specific DNA methylase